MSKFTLQSPPSLSGGQSLDGYVRTLYDYIQYAFTSIDEDNMTDAFKTQLAAQTADVTEIKESLGGILGLVEKLDARVTALEGGNTDGE